MVLTFQHQTDIIEARTSLELALALEDTNFYLVSSLISSASTGFGILFARLDGAVVD